MVGLYARWMIPGLLPFIWSLVLMKVHSAEPEVHSSVDQCLSRVAKVQRCVLCVQTLQAQTIMWPPAIVTAISALINIPVNLILIKMYGFTGAAAAFSVTRVIMFLLLVGEVNPSCTCIAGLCCAHMGV
jgi:Polysaccharide biosynthesis C-terminal domain